MRYLFLVLFVSVVLNARIAVVGDNYLTGGSEDIEMIFTKEHSSLASKSLNLEQQILKEYERSYGFKLDDKLYLGLLSNKNQVPNAFSTQFPLNMQMNYIGGSYMIDYMSSTSWLKTILIHESAHNFQLNPKKNPLSYYSHKVLKNVPFTMLFFMPIFPVPNAVENSFILEGNAVLNESRFGNGGRLYNGALLALAVTQAKAGYITPERTYNNHLYFPYGTHHYIVGGFFQLYLAQKYGIDRVNSYFYNFSAQYLPLQTNAIYEQTFGNDFEKEIADYSDWLKEKYNGFKQSRGDLIATSKFENKMTSTKDEIVFLAGDMLSQKVMHTVNKSNAKIISKKVDYPSGHLVKVGDIYYSATVKSKHHQTILGLYDEDAILLKGSDSKIVHGELKSGGLVYFDVNSSFDEPMLYVNGQFYDKVNSSVYVDESDNLYYFKQNGKTRTLYKNTQALFSYQGWFGFVSDGDDNRILFIANSEFGSTAFVYENSQIYRVTLGDDVIDAKFLDGKNLLISTITADNVSYIKTPINLSRSEVFNRTYFFENKYALNDELTAKTMNEPKSYSSVGDIYFSSLNQSVSFTDDGIDFGLGVNFSDPLKFNSFNTFINKDDSETIVGVGYTNSQYRLEYGISTYGILEEEIESKRDFAANIFASYPVYEEGYHDVNIKALYHIDNERYEREPLVLSLNYRNGRSYGNSFYMNKLHQFSLFGLVDRDDKTAGFKYNYFTDFSNQFYGGIGVKYAKSDAGEIGKRRGVAVDDNALYAADFSMPTIKRDIYVKDVAKGSLSLYKVFDFDKYFFSVPIALRRESIFAKYNYYDITFLDDLNADFNEYIAGVTFELMILHKLVFPVTFEYMYNDNLRDPERFKIGFNLAL